MSSFPAGTMLNTTRPGGQILLRPRAARRRASPPARLPQVHQIVQRDRQRRSARAQSPRRDSTGSRPVIVPHDGVVLRPRDFRRRVGAATVTVPTTLSTSARPASVTTPGRGFTVISNVPSFSFDSLRGGRHLRRQLAIVDQQLRETARAVQGEEHRPERPSGAGIRARRQPVGHAMDSRGSVAFGSSRTSRLSAPRRPARRWDA